jgi:ubiquinone/menaquinone biosynthesis C-methylase UbiE
MLKSPSDILWQVYGYTYDGLLHFYPYQELVERVLEAANVQPKEDVLDLGCGTGNQLMRIASATNGKLCGVDASKSMIRIAQRKLPSHSVKLERADVVSFLKRQPSSSFDKIISTNVVYALSNRDEFWQELLRVLRPEGLAIISTAISHDSSPLIEDQLKHKGLLRSLHPKLIGVFLCDALINVFGASGRFEFPNEQTLREEISAASGVMSKTEPCYSGVNVLFSVRHQ